ncbi:LMBR1 domain-containing protein 2 homolog isoform X2 [Selaginella moellendorffii]|uniref:LMBR1 domain-containing protein 2 homolog isoform X2 n=1 Tax=Selaginella moellendorffii TaxID=88036 RepID=UPI000D1C88EE|nr:LMBR1 domain-containing protein 2 homolog isoform X2 [Selaginella moellendorffii]|eukprot:XP_024534652.1 LMBR1 domain-containing protein 2 homolog isoform X2 [Selaginella moellendorffii]
MWVFYTFALPTTLALVGGTLRYFSAPSVPTYVLITVGYAWFCSLSIIILVPADIWTTLSDGDPTQVSMFWGWSYWSTFILTWIIVPLMQSYEDAGDFTVKERLKTSVKANVVYYVSVGVIGIICIVILISLDKLKWSGVFGFAMTCSTLFGLITGAFLLGFGFIEIPRSMWRKANWQYRFKFLTHRVAKVAVNLDDAHQELSTVVVICQAISNQMSRRDVLRPCMDFIEQMLVEMMQENPSFKPSAGRMSDNDMEYDQDISGMAELRRRLRQAHFTFARYKSEYGALVLEALELEDTMKNYERGAAEQWLYTSGIRPPRTGTMARRLDHLEWIWRCSLRPKILRLFAIIFGGMTAALLIAEATLLPAKVDLSFFSFLINVTSDSEILVQVLAFVPVMYMCACTYFSLFKLGMFTYYYFAPKYTNAVSLLMICSMVSRYAPPVCYNYLGLIRLEDERHKNTVFEKRMGVSSSGNFLYTFNRVYPIFMVIYTAVIATNALNRLIDFFGSWRRFRFDEEAEETDGCNPSGVIIIRKERAWLERGSAIGEHLVPLARNFGSEADHQETEAMLQQGPQEPFKIHANGHQQHAGPLPKKDANQGFSAPPPAPAPPRVPRGPHADIAAKYMAMREQRKEGRGQPQVGMTNFSRAPPPVMPFIPESMPVAVPVGGGGVGAPATRFEEQASRWKFALPESFSGHSQNLAASREPPRPVAPSSADTLDSIFDSLRTRREFDEEGDDVGLTLLPRQ